MRSTALSCSAIFALCCAARAGDSTVTVTNGALVIAGSSSADDLTIDQDGLTNPKQFRITPTGGSTVNGSASAQLFNGVSQDVKCSLGDGLDKLAIVRAVLPRDLRITGGAAGNLALTVSFATVKRDCRVTTANQRIGAVIERTILRRDVRFAGGSDGDQFIVGEGSIVARNLRINAGGSSDFIQVDHSLVRGDFVVDGGDGDDIMSVAISTVEGDVRVTDDDGTDDFDLFDATVQGSARARLGSGNDSASVQCGTVGKGVDLDLGSGNNTLFTLGARLENRLKVRAGAGNDEMSIYVSTSIQGSASFRMGDGVNVLDGQNAEFARGLNVKFGAGADTFTADRITVVGPTKVDLGRVEDPESDAVSFLRSAFGQDLFVSGNSGVQDVILTDLFIDRRLGVKLGDGGKSIAVVTSRTETADLRTGSATDVITLSDNTIVSHDLVIRSGDGDNLMTLFKATVGGDLLLKAGSGNDTLTLNTFILAGKRKVDLGSGANVES